MSDSTGPSTGHRASSTGMIADPNANGPTAAAASTKVSVLRGVVVVVVSAVVDGTVDGTVDATVVGAVVATVVGVTSALVAGTDSVGTDATGATVVSDTDVVDSTITAVGADPPHAPATPMATATSTPIRIRTASHLTM